MKGAVKDGRAWIEALCWWGFGEFTLPTLSRRVREATDEEDRAIMAYVVHKWVPLARWLGLVP